MSHTEVLYSCGQCGYPLKLCSSDRSIMGVGANYFKESKKGKISFLNFDESRFKLHDELKCGLYIQSKTSWKLHRVRTKFYCRQCEAFIGYVNGDGVHSLVGNSGYEDSDSNSYGQKRFWVKIRALQPDQELDDNYSPSMTDGKDIGSKEDYMEMTEEESCSTSIDDLPEECLLVIAGQLSSREDREAFSSTCRRWLRVESCMRHTLNLPHHFCDEKSYDHLLECLLNRFRAVNTVSLTGCVKLSDFALSILMSKCPQLRRLYLDRCLNITDDGLRFVGFSSLELLSLYRCDVGDVGLEYISRECPSLQVLNLSYCSNITDVGVSALGRGCLALRDINISNCCQIRGGGFSSFSSLARLDASCCKLSDKGLTLAARGCEKLEYLDVSHMRNSSEPLGPLGFASIGTFCKSLQFLNLKLCRVLDDTAVIEIAKGCQALKEWNLAVCSGIKEAGWRAVAEHCKNLEILHINRCRSLTDGGLVHMRNGCPRLMRLYLNGCPLVSRVGIELFKRYRCQVAIVTLEFMGENLYEL